MKILVVAGGSSAEREISLRSGQAVYNALRQSHDVELYDPVDTDRLLQKAHAAQAVLIMLHGQGGEDGQIQKLFEDHHIFHYLGADSAASALAFNKWRCKIRLEEYGILTPKASLVTRDQFLNDPLTRSPFVLKPVDEGSSIDTVIARQPPSELRQYDYLFDRHETMLLEQLIEGIELTVAVVGSKALPPVEIQPPPGEEFDYANKYNGATREICPPASVNAHQVQQLCALAERVHSVLGCRDLSRTDIIAADDHRNYVLELNTIPGLTDQSLVPKAAHAAGMSFEQLASKLALLAAARYVSL